MKSGRYPYSHITRDAWKQSDRRARYEKSRRPIMDEGPDCIMHLRLAAEARLRGDKYEARVQIGLAQWDRSAAKYYGERGWYEKGAAR